MRPTLGLLLRWRLSPLLIAAYAVVSMVGGFIALDPGRAGWVLVIVSSSASTAAAIIVLLGGTLLLRVVCGAWRIGLWFIPVAVVVGLVRAWVLVLVADATGTSVTGAPTSIAVSSAFSAVVWLGLVGLLIAGQDAYRDRYRALVREVAVPDDLTDLDQHPSVNRMRSSLAEALAAAQQEPSPEQWIRASQAIRAEIDTTLRPLSHRLWFGGADEEPHARWSRVVRDAVAGFDVPIRATLALWLVGSLVGGVAMLGSARGLLASVLSTAVLAVALAVAKRLVGARQSLGWGSLALVVTSLLPVVLTDAAMRAMGIESSLTWENGLGALLWLALAGILVATASVNLASSDRRAVLGVVARGTARERVSSYLHNGLQSELTGMAMQLDVAAQTDDARTAREALERVHALLARSLSEDLATFHEEPMARAERVAQAWAGICDVSIVIDPAAAVDPLLAPAVTAAEELISNAVRHSGATSIHVEVARDGTGSLVVECCANALGQRPSGSGLGSALLTSVSSEGMAVSENGDSTRYRLRITASRRA